MFMKFTFISYLTFFIDFYMQLRNLVWATSKHDVYLMSNFSVMHWSSLSGNLSEVLNFAGHVAPTEVVQPPVHNVYDLVSLKENKVIKWIVFHFFSAFVGLCSLLPPPNYTYVEVFLVIAICPLLMSIV